MKFLKFIFLSVFIINFNVLAMDEYSDIIEVINEGTALVDVYLPNVGLVKRIPPENQNHDIHLSALKNMDLIHEIKYFGGNDARKKNYTDLLCINLNKSPTQFFGNPVKSIVKPYSCNLCNNAHFYLKEGLNMHFWRNHHFCLYCNILFNTAMDYEKHSKENHSFCDECYLYFGGPEILGLHVYFGHPKSVDCSRLNVHFTDSE